LGPAQHGGRELKTVPGQWSEPISTKEVQVSWSSSALNLPPAKKWEYEPNPLVGEQINRYAFHGDYEPAEMLIILPEGAEEAFSVLCGKAVLRSFVENKDPQIGGRVGIKYIGKREGAAGPYDDFNTAYEPPENGSPENGPPKADDPEPPSGPAPAPSSEDDVPF